MKDVGVICQVRDFELLDPPSTPWMDRLRRGHYIWLVKENQIAQVANPWEPPEPGCFSGRMFIERFNSDHIKYRSFAGIEYWFTDQMGRGLDGLQIIQPIVDNLPENPEPLEPQAIRDIHNVLAQISRRLDAIELDLMIRSGG